MYKPYSDSYLMTKNKKTLIEYLRIAEHNYKVCEETIDQQYKNCMKLLKDERAKAIDDYVKILVTEFDFVDTDIQGFIEIGESIKNNTENNVIINRESIEHDKQIRTKVIDEFVKTLEKRQTFGNNEFEMGLDFTDILEVAEQLKEAEE